MNQIAKLQSICQKENVKVEVLKAPRYVLPFLVDYEEEIIFIRREGSNPLPCTPMIRVKEETEDDYELTGSPLHTSLDDSLINNPMTQTQVELSEYYNHSPLSHDQALRIINHFALMGNPTSTEKELPVWVLCDAANGDRTVLLMLWRKHDGWVGRGTAVLVSAQSFLQNMNPSLDTMLKDHLKISNADKSEVSYLVKACYSCNRGGVSEMIDEFNKGSATLKMHFSWKRPHTYLSFPPYDATSHLEMNMTIGCECPSLWQEIERLQEINFMLEKNPAERGNQTLMTLATMNLTVMASSLRGQLHSYISTGKLPPSLNCNRVQGMPKAGVTHILDFYEDVTEGRRDNMDVTEVLWDILKGCDDIVELSSCFKMIIREAASGRFTPKILPDNKTTVGKIIQGARDILQMMRLQLRGNESLHLLWELGHLKLQRDYKYIFNRLQLNLQEDGVFKGLQAISSVNKQQREEGIENLVAVHTSMEVLMVFKSQLSVDDALLSLLVTSALSKLSSSALEFSKSLVSRCMDSSYLESDLQKMVTLSIPVHTKISIPLVKGGNPTSWSFSLSVEKKKRKVVSVFHGNTNDEFPPEINDKGDRAMSANKESSIVKYTFLSDHLFS